MNSALGMETRAASTGDDRTVAAQAFGTLATRLNETIGRARQALAPHAGVLPEGTLADLDRLLAEFARRRVRIAIYGEVKAGKSTLLNAVAGAPLSPVAFEPLTSMPVRVTYGDSTAWHVGSRRLESVADVEGLMRESTDSDEVVVETDLDLLELGGQVDLLDTPGVGSAAHLDAVSAETLRALDAVVLVVRYPALFTQFTRRLMDGLETDISKLFVVWNLDADCADLSPAERARHAETLRANIAGAHELFLVDARAGFRAMQADDGAASVASGLTALIAALRRFASSKGREVAALREAAKRVHASLAAGHRCLVERHTALDRALADARARLQAARAAADAERATARARLADYEARVSRIGHQATTTAAKLAADVHAELRRARRRWVRRGDAAALAAAIKDATARYADALDAANRATLQSLQAEAADFGTTVPTGPRIRTELSLGPLAPEDRMKRATTGRGQLLRRALWRGWYLPGLAALERNGIGADLAAQAAWLTTTAQAVREAARATLAARLADITQRADAESQQIKSATSFTANEAEFGGLSEHLPVVAAQCEAVEQLATQARGLL